MQPRSLGDTGSHAARSTTELPSSALSDWAAALGQGCDSIPIESPPHWRTPINRKRRHKRRHAAGRGQGARRLVLHYFE